MSPCKSRSPDVFRMQIRDIKNYVKLTTAPYKYPWEIEFIAELLKTISGKIKRNELRAAELKKYTGIR
jgi:acetyl-CoA synthetase